ncbi:MAG: MFS transporter [Burkholderiales bacterium]
MNATDTTAAQRRLYELLLLVVCLHMAFAGSRITMALFALMELKATALTVGALISLLAALPMLFSVHAGRWTDRVGVWRPMAYGAGAVTAGTLLAAAFPQLATLFISSCLIGSGFMLFHIAVNHAFGTLGPPERRAKNFGLLALAFSVSNVLGPAAVGFAIDGIGARATFLLLASFPCVALVALLARRFDAGRAAPETRGGNHRLVDLLKSRTLRRVFVVSAVLSMAWDAFTFMVPVYAAQELRLSASVIGLILGVYGSAIFFVRLVFPLLVHRVTEWQMLIFSMLSSAACLALFPLIHTVPLLVGLAFILGIGLGGAQPVIMSLLYSRAPPGRTGEAVGLRTLLLNISQTGIPLMFGALGTALGMSPVFWAMAAALAFSGWYAAPARAAEKSPPT